MSLVNWFLERCSLLSYIMYLKCDVDLEIDCIIECKWVERDERDEIWK